MINMGDIMSTVGVFSTVDVFLSTVGDTLSTVGMFSTMGDIMMHVVDIMSTVGVFSTTEGYLEYHGNCSVLSSYPEYCGEI